MTKIQTGCFCGPPRTGFRETLGCGKLGGQESWFGKGRVHYLHKARIGIRWACELLDIGHGDEVLAPSYNCGSELDALLSSGAKVTLYRIDKKTNIDFQDMSRHINKRTKCIYVTHYFGFPQPLGRILELCKQHNLYLVEDCALSLFSRADDTPIGSQGDIAIFNFPKALPVPDGGAIVINNNKIRDIARSMRSPDFGDIVRETLPLFKWQLLHATFGKKTLYNFFSKSLKRSRRALPDDNSQNRPDMPESYYYDEMLTDKRISKISKGILQTLDMGMIVRARRRNFARMLELFSYNRQARPLFTELPDGVSPLYFPVIISNRNKICEKLFDLTIVSCPWWAGYHRDFSWDKYPEACFLKDNILALPVHQQLNRMDIDYIAEKVMHFVKLFEQ